MDKEQVQNLIKELVEKIAQGSVKVSITEDNGMNTWYSVVVNEPHLFTTKEGEGLHALNHIVRRIIDTKTPSNISITSNEKKREPSLSIDINDFQKRRVESIRAVAHMMGERARYFKSNIEVDPMSAFDRRIVHEFLSDASDLKTESMGFGPTRRVVIKYTGSL